MKYKGNTFTSEYIKRSTRVTVIGYFEGGMSVSTDLVPYSHDYNAVQLYAHSSATWFYIIISMDKSTGTLKIENTSDGDNFYIRYLIIDYI